MSKTRLSIACIGLAAGWLAMAYSGASAQEWRRGEYEYFKEAHKFGPHCEYRAVEKRVHCETKGLEFVCSAIAHPCRPH